MRKQGRGGSGSRRNGMSEREMLEIRMNVVESEIAKMKAKYESA
ncbi:hypothetical protein [Bacilliculturomica massiliensis]|nr:hypothetical protein [Bacilliculturomica massiliensis]